MRDEESDEMKIIISRIAFWNVASSRFLCEYHLETKIRVSLGDFLE